MMEYLPTFVSIRQPVQHTQLSLNGLVLRFYCYPFLTAFLINVCLQAPLLHKRCLEIHLRYLTVFYTSHPKFKQRHLMDQF